jgi:hypothetical protein
LLRSSCAAIRITAKTIGASLAGFPTGALRPPARPRRYAHGGWSFACDPDLPAALEPAIWRPELAPESLLLAAAPIEYSHAVPLDPAAIGIVRGGKDGPDGRYLILDDGVGRHRLWLRDDADGPLAIVLPLDEDGELRLSVALRLLRRIRGRAGIPPPPRLAVTRLQRRRLTLLLNIIDRLADGATKREIARALIYPRMERVSAAEWKASSERRRTQRLCDEAKSMVAAGYRQLLRGR